MLKIKYRLIYQIILAGLLNYFFFAKYHVSITNDLISFKIQVRFFSYYIIHYICAIVLYFILHQQEKVLLNCRLIGNRVQITNCRATVSNACFLPVYIHCPPKADGKDGKNVTSQETCLYRIDNAFAN